MDEYINANSFKSSLSILGNKMSENGKAVIDQVLELLNDYEKEDVATVVHGKWVEKEVIDNTDEDFVWKIEQWQSARCSVCGKYHTTPYMYYFDDYNYCPHCGAKMTEGRDNEVS